MDENRYRLRLAVSGDTEFLYRVYASTREQEMALMGWSTEEAEQFLRFQYKLQQTQYHQNYPHASFDIIYVGDRQAGCLYVNRGQSEIRIVDIALLPEFRGRGIGTHILRDIFTEAEAANLPIRLQVAYDNPVSNLYQRLGFSVTSDTGVYHSMERSPPPR